LTLDQTLTVLQSQTYTINFYLANSGCSVADSDCPGYYNYFDVIFDGDTLFSQDNVPTTNGAYQEYSFTGATSAAQTSAVLQFDSTNDNGYFYLDDVSVTAAATPEPASFVLMAAGGLAIGFVRRRRRLASARRLGFSEMRG
jgi:hypothetical protein